MHEEERDLYREQWSPNEYLKQFYSTNDVADDEIANLRFAIRNLSTAGIFQSAIEVGCGPTLHHALMLAPYVKEIHLADYLSSNLTECRRSLSEQVGAHDWGPYLRGMFGDNGAENWRMLRERVTRFVEVDIRSPQTPKYDLVASYYCAEAVASDRTQWERCLEGLASLVAPGGVLLLGAMRRCREYLVLRKSFPAAYVDEADFQRHLPRFGFDSKSMIVEAVPIKDWSSQGFSSICCVWARKSGF